jgi:diguanylate cyclase (GGDEF)-like protein
VTISAGVAATSGDAALTPHDLIRQADEKLYEAKNAGRNRVVA